MKIHFAAKLTHNLQSQENLVKMVLNVLAISYYQYIIPHLILDNFFDKPCKKIVTIC
jgi:hypothetical protein